MNMLSAVTNRPRLITAAVLGALALSFGAVSMAADDSDVPRTVVEFGDLDISSHLGAATLYGRIESAADEVCHNYDTEYDPLDLRAYSIRKACIHDAIARAVHDVGSDELFAVYSADHHQADQ